MSTQDSSLEQLSTTIEQRLYEASKFWDQACKDYHSINDFTSSLNALIQSLRNITFILQSNKKYIPDFNKWYETKRNEMRNDSALKWLHDSRNIIVKSSNLKIKSKTKVDLLNWKTHPFMEIEVDPLDDNLKIKSTILSLISQKNLFDKLRDPLIRIERLWIADNLPDKEILDLTAYCYRYLKTLIFEVYVILEFPTDKLNINFEKNIQILRTFETFLNHRTTILELKSFKSLEMHEKIVKANDPELSRKVKKHYGFLSSPKKTKDTFTDLFDFCTENSKLILSVDGYHVPTAFFCNKDGKSEIYSFIIEDQAQKYYFMRKFSDDIKIKKITGIILILESWIKNLSKEIKGELLMVIAVKKDFFEGRITPFYRKKDKITFGSTMIDKKCEKYHFLKPIVDAINSL